MTYEYEFKELHLRKAKNILEYASTISKKLYDYFNSNLQNINIAENYFSFTIKRPITDTDKQNIVKSIIG